MGEILNIEIGSKLYWVFDNMENRSLDGHPTVKATFGDSGISEVTVKRIIKDAKGWFVEVEEYPVFGFSFDDFGKTVFLKT